MNGELMVTVVDDDPAALKAMSRLLRSEGLTADTYSSPRQFLETYDATRVGCLILDVTLPELSGLDLQQSLGEKGGAPPIIFLTGTGDTPDTVRAMKQGAVDFLTKPVDAVVLLAAVRTALAHQRAARRV